MQHANLLTSKLFCTHCGMPYYRRESKDKYGNKNSKWVCSGKINNGKDSCVSFLIYEKEIKPLLFEVFRSAAMLAEYERMYKVMTSDGNLVKKIEDAESELQLTFKKKSKLLELVALDSITVADFKTMTAACNEEMKALKSELAGLHQQQESSQEFRSHMEKIRSVLRAAEADANEGKITKNFIDKIYVTPEEDGPMRLSVKIFTGDTTEKYLKKLKRRTGHMFKEILFIEI